MKKFLLMALLLILSWCWTQQAVQEMEVYNALDDEAYFSYEWITIIPAWAFEVWELPSHNEFKEDAVAWPYSKYLVVWYWLVNDTKEPVTFWTADMPFIFDSEWRRFNPDSELTNDFYLPNPILLFEVKPWISADWSVIYEVPKDATWFYIQAWNKIVMLNEEKE